MTRHAHALVGLAATALAVAIGVIGSAGAPEAAQQGGGAGGAAPAPRPLIPMAASTILLNPDAHYGENVSLMAAVDAVLSKTAFSVDQDKAKSTGKDVLVIAPGLTGLLQMNAYVTVQGEVIKFDPADIARRVRGYTLDLPPDLVAKYTGRPAILATSVITAELVDIGKRPPPPMTPAELAFSLVMKGVQPAVTALRAGLDASSVEQSKAQTAILAKAFADTQAFFTARGTADAVGWAQDAAKLVAGIDQAAAGGKWDDAKTSAASLTQVCSTCHAAHRERQDDGTYRVKGTR